MALTQVVTALNDMALPLLLDSLKGMPGNRVFELSRLFNNTANADFPEAENIQAIKHISSIDSKRLERLKNIYTSFTQTKMPYGRFLEGGADIATGHRIYRRKVTPLGVGQRWIASVVYAKLRRFVTSTNIRDSETGIKFFNREKIIPILERIEDRHWFWDTEVMVRSYYEGLRIKEIPVLFVKNASVKSTVKFASDSWYYFRKLMRFRKVVKEYKRQKKRADG